MSDSHASPRVTFFRAGDIPLELHKVRIVQKLHLQPVERRLEAIREAGCNTFLLETKDIFLDMLTDSGTNAMSDRQLGSMMTADDAYAGSASFSRMKQAIKEVLGMDHVLPVHQGRAAENIISKTFVREGHVVPMNYHFTTTKAHIDINGGRILEIFTDEALKIKSAHPFKGNMDIGKLNASIAEFGPERIPYVRMEASTNLIGGQPFSMANMREVREVTARHGILLVLDVSLVGENAWFIKQREEGYANKPVSEILLELCGLCDMLYFSSRKVSFTRGGAIATNRKDLFDKMKDLVPLYEGFLTYGGMSVREIEAMAVGLYETTDDTVIGQSPSFIRHMVEELDQAGVPVITPAGGLGCHVDAMGFLPHVPQSAYPAGALAVALFIASGVRGMERGTISSVRDENGKDVLSDMELLRLAMPRRVFTLSQVIYAADRLQWLYANRDLVGGLRFVEEPEVLRFFLGRLEPIGNWPEKLAEKFRADFGDSL